MSFVRYLFSDFFNDIEIKYFPMLSVFFSQKTTPSGLCNWNSSSLQFVYIFNKQKRTSCLKNSFCWWCSESLELYSPQLFVYDEQMTKSNFICHKKQLVFLCSGMPSNNIIIIQNCGKKYGNTKQCWGGCIWILYFHCLFQWKNKQQKQLHKYSNFLFTLMQDSVNRIDAAKDIWVKCDSRTKKNKTSYQHCHTAEALNLHLSFCASTTFRPKEQQQNKQLCKWKIMLFCIVLHKQQQSYFVWISGNNNNNNRKNMNYNL